jgi:drug/metabolite transporter (DMT)-like permease
LFLRNLASWLFFRGISDRLQALSGIVISNSSARGTIMKIVARLSFLLITALWGSFYAFTKEALGRIDPVVFTFFEVLILVPVAFPLVVMNWKDLNKATFKRGFILGSFLALSLLIITVSLKFTNATNTAFFPSIGGVVGALITGIVLKRPLAKGVWFAGGLSLTGVLIILMTSGGGVELRGDLIAFLGASFFTIYIFLVSYDKESNSSQNGEGIVWLILGIEHLTLAFWVGLIALLFGDWQHLHPIFPRDVEIIVYIGMAANFIPYILSMFMLKYIDALEVSFISILEPIWASIIAFVYLGEAMPLSLYFGGALVIVGSVVHIWSTSGYSPSRGTRLLLPSINRYIQSSKIATIVYPMLLLSAGVFLLNWLGGSLSAIWHELSSMGPDLQILISQRQETSALLLIGHVLLWLIAWSALVVIGVLTSISAAHSLLQQSERSTFAALPILNSQSICDGIIGTTRRRVTRRLTTDESAPRVIERRTISLYDPIESARGSVRSKATRKLTSTVAQRRQVARERRMGMHVEE